MNGKTIELRRLIVWDHIETYKREEMVDNLIKLGKEVAKNRDIKTLKDLAQKMRT